MLNDWIGLFEGDAGWDESEYFSQLIENKDKQISERFYYSKRLNSFISPVNVYENKIAENPDFLKWHDKEDNNKEYQIGIKVPFKELIDIQYGSMEADNIYIAYDKDLVNNNSIRISFSANTHLSDIFFNENTVIELVKNGLDWGIQFESITKTLIYLKAQIEIEKYIQSQIEELNKETFRFNVGEGIQADFLKIKDMFLTNHDDLGREIGIDGYPIIEE